MVPNNDNYVIYFVLYAKNHVITIIWDHFSLGFLFGEKEKKTDFEKRTSKNGSKNRTENV